jgi:histidinol phosphatase-like PHP family hydrolase
MLIRSYLVRFPISILRDVCWRENRNTIVVAISDRSRYYHRMKDDYPFHDLQLHTTWSDGYHTVAQQVFLAATFSAGTQTGERLEAIAITDHLLPGSRLADGAEREVYRCEVARAGSHYMSAESVISTPFGTRPLVLVGVEATATDSSRAFSIDEQVASDFDWVLCDLSHASKGTLSDTPRSKASYERNVLAIYHAMCDASYIDVISHPFNTGNTDPALYPKDYSEAALTELAKHMADTRTVFDVMNVMPLWFHASDADPVRITADYVSLVSLFAERDVLFQMSSDDHRTGLGNIGWSKQVLRAAGVDPGQLVRPGHRLPSIKSSGSSARGA